MIKVVKTKPMVATKIKETSTTINTQREATEQVERPVYQGGLLNADYDSNEKNTQRKIGSISQEFELIYKIWRDRE